MNPDEILAQITELVQQYLALPGDTPVKPELESLLPVLQQAQGDQGAAPPDQGAMPPDQAGPPPDQGAPQGNLADLLGGGAQQEAPPSTGDSFRDATNAAGADIKSAKKETGTKTGIPEQFSKKKRSKAS
jgi:hypothetical protein